MHKDGEGDYRGWRSKTLSEVKPVKNISTNLQSFLEISLMQKEVHLSQKLWDHAYEYLNPFRLKEDNFLKKLPEIFIQVLSHTEQECQESLNQGKIHNQQNSNESLKYSES